MVTKPHTSPPVTRKKLVPSLLSLLILLILVGGLLPMLTTLNKFSTGILNPLGKHEYTPSRRDDIYQFMATRGIKAAGHGKPELLWEARKGAAQAGFFLATAMHCESTGKEDLARLWIGIHFIARGDVKRATPWVDNNPLSPSLDRNIDPKSYAAATWIDQEPLMNLLKASLF